MNCARRYFRSKSDVLELRIVEVTMFATRRHPEESHRTLFPDVFIDGVLVDYDDLDDLQKHEVERLIEVDHWQEWHPPTPEAPEEQEF